MATQPLVNMSDPLNHVPKNTYRNHRNGVNIASRSFSCLHSDVQRVPLHLGNLERP